MSRITTSRLAIKEGNLKYSEQDFGSLRRVGDLHMDKKSSVVYHM
jgi:hypothetical protein